MQHLCCHHTLASLTLALTLPSLGLAADSVVVLKNGDRISGEIRKIEAGELHIDPDYGKNVFRIDWDEVERVEGNKNSIIETSQG